MEDIVYYSELYYFYKELFTEKQRQYFEDYYFNNFSLGEIADYYNISRNAVYRQIKLVVNKLIEYEEKLKLKEKVDKLEECAKKVEDKEIREQILDLF